MQIDPSPQLQNQQRQIRQLQQHIHIIEVANHNLRQELNSMEEQKNHLQFRLDLDPIAMILDSAEGLSQGDSLRPSYNDLINRIQLYQEKVTSLQRQKTEYRSAMQRKDNQLINLKRDYERLSRSEMELMIENDSLKKQNARLLQSHQGWAKLVGDYEQKWELLEKQILQAKSQLVQNKDHNHLELQKCHEKFEKLTNTWLNADNFLRSTEEQLRKESQHERINELSDKLKKQSQIMQELGRELDLRNDEIANLLSQQKANSSQSGLEAYQHSLNQMIRENNQRERNYKELLQKYQKIALDLKESIKEKRQLQAQYENMKKLYEQSQQMLQGAQKLHTELQNAKRKLQRQNQLIIQCEKNFVSLIEENDAFYEMMRDRFGMEVLQDKMKEQLEQHRKRKLQRQNQDQWANTQELIEMNQKLMRKLRGK